jgi:hypothetical protein
MVTKTTMEKAVRLHILPTDPNPYPQIRNWQKDKGGEGRSPDKESTNDVRNIQLM